MLQSRGATAMPETGEPADIAVPDGDPLAAADAVLASMPVAATMLAGQLTFGGV
jgi:predicted amidohydrolase YtcJ